MKKILVTAIMAIGLFLTANAAMIDLGTTIGQPADVQSELSRLNGQIDLWNGLNDPDLMSAVGWNGVQTDTPNGGTSITLNLDGFDGYMLFKWGNMDHFYYVNDNLECPVGTLCAFASYDGNGLYTFLSDITPQFDLNGETAVMAYGPPNLGLSHYTTFSAVPEPGTATAGLLCAALMGLGFVKRKIG